MQKKMLFFIMSTVVCSTEGAKFEERTISVHRDQETFFSKQDKFKNSGHSAIDNYRLIAHFIRNFFQRCNIRINDAALLEVLTDDMNEKIKDTKYLEKYCNNINVNNDIILSSLNNNSNRFLQEKIIEIQKENIEKIFDLIKKNKSKIFFSEIKNSVLDSYKESAITRVLHEFLLHIYTELTVEKQNIIPYFPPKILTSYFRPAVILDEESMVLEQEELEEEPEEELRQESEQEELEEEPEEELRQESEQEEPQEAEAQAQQEEPREPENIYLPKFSKVFSRSIIRTRLQVKRELEESGHIMVTRSKKAKKLEMEQKIKKTKTLPSQKPRIPSKSLQKTQQKSQKFPQKTKSKNSAVQKHSLFKVSKK